MFFTEHTKPQNPFPAIDSCRPVKEGLPWLTQRKYFVLCCIIALAIFLCFMNGSYGRRRKKWIYQKKNHLTAASKWGIFLNICTTYTSKTSVLLHRQQLNQNNNNNIISKLMNLFNHVFFSLSLPLCVIKTTLNKYDFEAIINRKLWK